jgi:hypothetical protein
MLHRLTHTHHLTYAPTHPRSGTNHDHDQPPHLVLRSAGVPEVVNLPHYAGPETRCVWCGACAACVLCACVWRV